MAENENLGKAYFVKSARSLETMQLARAKDWKIYAAYYSMYFAVYALCMKSGIKSEIHSCTIELAKQFFLDEQDTDLLKLAFRARNDVQYYVDKEISSNIFDTVTKSAATFIAKCKRTYEKLSEDDIKQIRDNL